MRYSLADYQLSIAAPEEFESMFPKITIGGEGNYVGSINVSMKDNLYDVESYATGAYIFNKNLSKVGTISVSLNQLCEQVSQLKSMVQKLYTRDCEFSISISQRNSQTPMVSCGNAVPVKIPNQDMGSTAGMQTWEFLGGSIAFE